MSGRGTDLAVRRHRKRESTAKADSAWYVVPPKPKATDVPSDEVSRLLDALPRTRYRRVDIDSDPFGIL